MEKFLDWSLELGVKQVSVWIGSTENLRSRSIREISELFKAYYAFLDRLEKRMPTLDKYQVKVRFVGDLNKLPKTMLKIMGRIMSATAKYQRRMLNILVHYGGKFELVNVIKRIADKALRFGKVRITEKEVERNLLLPTPVDLAIRTGGHTRLSNFMLWQASYADIYYTKVLWPDFSRQHLLKAIKWFNSAQRNFGR